MGKEIQRLLLGRRKFGREPLRRQCGRQCGSSGSSLRSSSTPSASSPAPSNRRTAPLRQGARCLLGEIHPSASTGELEQTHLAIVEATTVTCVCDEEGSDLLVELGNRRESGGGDLTQSVVPSPHLITYSPDLQVQENKHDRPVPSQGLCSSLDQNLLLHDTSSTNKEVNPVCC